jgi:hypothetical protein
METNNNLHPHSDKPKRRPPQTPQEIALFNRIMKIIREKRLKEEAEILNDPELKD